MRRSLIFVLIVFSFVMCSKKPEEVKLKKETRAYNLAQDLSAIIPELNPDVNQVIVSTDNFNITTGEIVQIIQYSPEEYIQQLLKLPRKKIKRIVEGMARDLSDKKLLILSAKKSNITVSGQEIDSVMATIYRSYGGKTRFNMTLRDHKMDRDYFRQDVKNSLLADKYLNKVLGAKILVSDDEIKEYYNQDTTVTLRHIMVNTEGKDEPDILFKKRIINTVLKLAKKGVDFSSLAKKYSEDANTRDKGGLIENIIRGSYEAPFDSAAFATPVGKISGIIRTSYGFHIIKVLKRETGSQPFDEVKSSLKDKIYNDKWEKEKKAVLESLKKEYHYKFFPLY